MKYKQKKLTKKKLLSIYEAMLYPRLIEEKMLILLRQGKISKWFSGIGQEAIAVGATLAMQQDEMIFPMHRNLGVFTTRKVPLDRLFCQWQGKPHGFTNGRDRSFHFGTKEYNITGMISHLGPQLSLAAGVALSYKLNGDSKVSLAFTGEGGTSEGEFHEALNVASVWDLPVIFLIENNGYGLSTPTDEQYRCKRLMDKGLGYGMEAHQVDGNNVLKVYRKIDKLAKNIRRHPRPVLVECLTFRQRGHEEASGTKYVPEDLMEYWKKRDPVINYEKWLLSKKILDDELISQTRKKIRGEIETSLVGANSKPQVQVNTEQEIFDVYKPQKPTFNSSLKVEDSRTIRFIDAISEALDLSLSQHERLVLMGQDVAEYGGVFKITQGFLEKYGKERIRNTPLCESAIIGVGMGLSIGGYKAIVEMQFADFVTCGFNQIVNNLAKSYYRWGQNADVVIRMPTGGTVAAGPFHSQSTEAWFVHTAGLKVVYPSNPKDAKGLLMAAINDPNPVLYFEHKALYRSVSGEVPSEAYEVEIGKARIVKSGDLCTIITYGMGVHWAIEIVEERNYDAEIIDLRSLLPIDFETISSSIIRTGRAIILHEDVLTGGIGGEISAYINEHLFEDLDAPVLRCASLDTPIPFAPDLENNFLPKGRFRIALAKLLAY